MIAHESGGVESNLSRGACRTVGRPSGLLHFCDVYPPLKRWANLARPSGTGFVGVQIVFVETGSLLIFAGAMV